MPSKNSISAKSEKTRIFAQKSRLKCRSRIPSLHTPLFASVSTHTIAARTFAGVVDSSHGVYTTAEEFVTIDTVEGGLLLPFFNCQRQKPC
jgi:hypothetical protein